MAERIHFLKGVWQDCILLESGQRYALVDSGDCDNYSQIAAYLRELGVMQLDWLILTHYHRDHYGNAVALAEEFPVGYALVQPYSGMDATDGSGKVADDAYRAMQMAQFESFLVALRARIGQVTLIGEDTPDIAWGAFHLQLLQKGNQLHTIFHDPASPRYHQYCYNENGNSLAIFARCNGCTAFLGGDIFDLPDADARANYVNLRLARTIATHSDIYKAPHHGLMGSSVESLKLHNPRFVVVTNFAETVKNRTTLLQELAESAPQAKVLYTEHQGYCFALHAPGNIEVSAIQQA